LSDRDNVNRVTNFDSAFVRLVLAEEHANQCCLSTAKERERGEGERENEYEQCFVSTRNVFIGCEYKPQYGYNRPTTLPMYLRSVGTNDSHNASGWQAKA
jgi:hypothetical protein